MRHRLSQPADQLENRLQYLNLLPNSRYALTF